MTKDELEKEARFRTKGWKEQENCVQSYIAGAKPREKRIEELEKENKELKEQNRSLLKSCEGATMMYKDLCKAKELLNEFMRISKASDEDFEHDYSELIGETEQFLKEVEE